MLGVLQPPAPPHLQAPFILPLAQQRWEPDWLDCLPCSCPAGRGWGLVVTCSTPLSPAVMQVAGWDTQCPDLP